MAEAFGIQDDATLSHFPAHSYSLSLPRPIHEENLQNSLSIEEKEGTYLTLALSSVSTVETVPATPT
jgi:hypothetical protein